MSELGLGLYTIGEAAQLIGAERRAIRRWLFGYDYTMHRGGKSVRKHSGPLWHTQYEPDEFGEPALGFLDLLELRVVHRFVACGVPLIVVRRCLQTARDLFGTDYPMTRQRFATDGETIFHQVLSEDLQDDEPGAALLNLKNRQYAFRDIIKASLYDGIEYGPQGAARWFPSRGRVVVLDPGVEFGHPTLASSGVPTVSLYASYLAEGRSAANVARLFEVPSREVMAAVRFEEQLRKAA